nr:MAG TPA: tail assembly chaperone protein [Caudoviricetes sp.]
MNLADALLAADAGKITKKEHKSYEVKRLSAIMGEPFVLDLRQIPNKRVREIQDDSMKIEGGKTSVDQYKLTMGLLCDGIANKDFDNRDVLKHYGAATRKDLFDTLFNAGEIQDIANIISELCGFDSKKTEEQVDAVKN